MKVSRLWTELSNSLFQSIDPSALDDFRAPGGINRRLAAWDPQDRSLRYYKFLLFRVARQKSPAFYDLYRRLGPVDVGRPVSVSVEGCAINIDHLFAVEEFEFLSRATDIGTLRTVLEIGAGFGRTAQALLMLTPAIERYVIIDLPEVLRLSRLYLKHILPPKVFAKLSFVNALDGIVDVVTPDLVINIDSFQEMPPETIAQYMRAPIAGARAFYCKNPIGKYDPASVGIEVRDPAALADVFSLGRCTDVIDIFDEAALTGARQRYVDAYRPGANWDAVAESPMEMFPYLHHVLYRRT